MKRRTRYLFLPDDPEFGYTPYLWLVYLSGLPTWVVLAGGGWVRWVALAAVVAAFLPLYFLGYWVDGAKRLAVIAGITLLGAVYLPWNLGAGVFFIYAAAFLGNWPSRWQSLTMVGALTALAALEPWALGRPVVAWVWAPILVVMISFLTRHQAEVTRSNARLRLAQEEVERLAKAAERERIGRDLHDLLGHTLSVIAVKAELAAKLVERDPARARTEIEEVHAVSRRALAEVREAVHGYRVSVSGGLADAVDQAREVLGSAGIQVELAGEPAAVAQGLGPRGEAVLALALREAVTNVLRHAGAATCRLGLALAESAAVLTVEDDGRGGNNPEGAGLSGMRERIEALGGRFLRDGSRGTRLRLELPIAAAAK